ncbi:hypothetical protein F4678DRAFT_348197 [Xylaria arbuscula]|nr:hypothetical protein F4678DRAFT_348197 [Xylaria arbuscula]
MALPTPRDLLTSLISSLSSIPIPDTAPTTTNPVPSHGASNHQASASSSVNPFRLIPPAYRPLLTTLHVIYPSTLLPALDLLDRRLVTRVILKQDTAQHPRHIQTGYNHNIDPDLDIPIGEGNSHITQKQEVSRPAALYHLVRSAQPQSHRRQHSTSTGGQSYVVRLESWNCTCAAFAFSAFPPLPSPIFSSSPGDTVSRYEISPAAKGGDAKPGYVDGTKGSENTGQNWEFGGLSADGRDGTGGVSCCKHLLACVLAEKWDAVLGMYIEDRAVGKEEAAGLVGDL